MVVCHEAVRPVFRKCCAGAPRVDERLDYSMTRDAAEHRNFHWYRHLLGALFGLMHATANRVLISRKTAAVAWYSLPPPQRFSPRSARCPKTLEESSCSRSGDDGPSLKILPFQHRLEPPSRTIPISTGQRLPARGSPRPAHRRAACPRCRHARHGLATRLRAAVAAQKRRRPGLRR